MGFSRRDVVDLYSHVCASGPTPFSSTATRRGPRVVVGETYTLIGARHDLLEALGLRDVLFRRPRRHAREDGLERGHVRRCLRRALRKLCAGIDRQRPTRGDGVTRDAPTPRRRCGARQLKTPVADLASGPWPPRTIVSWPRPPSGARRPGCGLPNDSCEAPRAPISSRN